MISCVSSATSLRKRIVSVFAFESRVILCATSGCVLTCRLGLSVESTEFIRLLARSQYDHAISIRQNGAGRKRMTSVKFRRVQHDSIQIPPGGAKEARAFFG